jgi:hypothetical protein
MAHEPNLTDVDQLPGNDVTKADLTTAQLLEASLDCLGRIQSAIGDYYDVVNGLFDD